MKIVELLAQIEELRKQYNVIADKYEPIYLESESPMHIGSYMWHEAVCIYKSTSISEVTEEALTIEGVKADSLECLRLVKEIEDAFKAQGLDSLVSSTNCLVWMGIMNEEESSRY